MTDLRIWRDLLTNDLCFSGRISRAEMEDVLLTAFDLALLDACDSPEATAADKLLGFEVLFRNILTVRNNPRI